MSFKVSIEGTNLPEIFINEELNLGFNLHQGYRKKENGLTALNSVITISYSLANGETKTYYKGTLGKFITSARFTLKVEGENEVIFYKRDEMDNYIRELVNEYGYSIKTSLSIIDEGETGNYINQFLGEFHHYLNDWDEENTNPLTLVH